MQAFDSLQTDPMLKERAVCRATSMTHFSVLLDYTRDKDGPQQMLEGLRYFSLMGQGVVRKHL